MPNTIQVFQFERGKDEAVFVANDISVRIAGGEEPRNFAVLARAATHLEEIANELKKAHVPFVIAQTAGLLRTRVVIDVLSLLRAALERGNSNAWYQVCVSRISQLPPADLVECIDYGRRKNFPLARVLLSDLPPEFGEETRAAVSHLIKSTKLEKDFLSSNKPSIILFQLLEQSGYFKNLVTEIEATGNGLEEINLINQFLEFAADWEAQHRNATPYDFLADCDRLLEVGEEGDQLAEITRDAVQLLTVHSAKGLEFKTVYVVSMIEGRFPGIERSEGIEIPDGLIREKTINENHHIEEERRLAYVAFTRAKENLILTYAEKYSSSEGARLRKPSRFISEAGLGDATSAAGSPVRVGEAVAETSQASESNLGILSIKRTLKDEYSFTQLKTFENCPYQYWFNHILKLPIKSKWTMNFGRSIHLALEGWYKMLRERAGAKQASLFETAPIASDPTPPSSDELIKILQRVWIADGYPSAHFHDEKKAAAEKMLRDYYRAHEQVWRLPTHIEQRFKIIVGGEKLTGSIDRIDTHADGAVELIDYKTGTPKKSEDLKFEDKEQLLIYHLAAERQLNLQPKLLTYYYLQDQSTATFTAKPKDLEKIDTFVAETAAEMRKGTYPAKPSQYTCKNCDYKDICPWREL